MAKRNFFVRESELDDYQRLIINKRTNNSFIVKGCAGSGKSILALWKAKQIQDEGLGSCQVIVLTKALKQYMADGINQIGLNRNMVDYHWYWENRKNSPMADYIIVDEAQDFSEEDIRKFKRCARKALLLYGDSAQQLYAFIKDKRTISMEEMSVITGFPTEQLVYNHRLPKKVARVAQIICAENDDLESRCKNEGTEKPKIYCLNSYEDQLDMIAEIIKNRNLNDVGILLKSNGEVEKAYNYLRRKGLNVEAKMGQEMDLNFKSDNPKIMTYHSSKGLQFETVFIPECYCSKPEDRNPLYVAMTRTYSTLYIMYSNSLSSFFNAVPSSLYETSVAEHDEI